MVGGFEHDVLVQNRRERAMAQARVQLVRVLEEVFDGGLGGFLGLGGRRLLVQHVEVALSAVQLLGEGVALVLELVLGLAQHVPLHLPLHALLLVLVVPVGLLLALGLHLVLELIHLFLERLFLHLEGEVVLELLRRAAVLERLQLRERRCEFLLLLAQVRFEAELVLVFQTGDVRLQVGLFLLEVLVPFGHFVLLFLEFERQVF